MHGNRVPEEEIETQCEALRKKLQDESSRGRGPAGAASGKGLKMHQVHELAAAKIKQDDRFRSALGISKNYEEGGHWKKQEERLRMALEKKEGEE